GGQVQGRVGGAGHGDAFVVDQERDVGAGGEGVVEGARGDGFAVRAPHVPHLVFEAGHRGVAVQLVQLLAVDDDGVVAPVRGEGFEAGPDAAGDFEAGGVGDRAGLPGAFPALGFGAVVEVGLQVPADAVLVAVGDRRSGEAGQAVAAAGEVRGGVGARG